MAWFGGPPPRDESTLIAILRKVDAVEGKIDRTVEVFRRELGDTVREMGQQYQRADVANQRYAEINKRCENIEGDIKSLQSAPAQQSQTAWMRYGVIAAIAFGSLGGLIGLISLLSHLSYHP